jgi:hypothetical protein
MSIAIVSATDINNPVQNEEVKNAADVKTTKTAKTTKTVTKKKPTK